VKGIRGSGSASAKEHLAGHTHQARRPSAGARTALYLRVSTPEQKPDLQYDGLRGYAARAGLEVVRDYCDIAVSGRREGRPQLNALMTAARKREIDCVLVWKFDRFARSTRHLLAALEEFDHLGVRFISVQDQIDTDSPMGRAMFTIIAAMAELESTAGFDRLLLATKPIGCCPSRSKGRSWPQNRQESGECRIRGPGWDIIPLRIRNDALSRSFRTRNRCGPANRISQRIELRRWACIEMSCDRWP
jgi:predicted site-specific integrase-resolvase